MDVQQAAIVSLVRKMCRTGELSAALRAANLSYAEAGAAVGKAGVEIARYAKGEALPRKDTALRIGELLGELAMSL